MSRSVLAIKVKYKLVYSSTTSSQERNRGSLERGFFAGIEQEYGIARYREPLPRRPSDSRAVSDPKMVADEFTSQLMEARP